MDTVKRHKLQGVSNIIRFNWHYFVAAVIAMLFLISVSEIYDQYRIFSWCLACFVLLSTFASIFISWYVYDYSGFYSLRWVTIKPQEGQTIANINAGFDETSGWLASKFPGAELKVIDFYDATKHTEVSVERARKSSAPYPGTQRASTRDIPLAENSLDIIFLIFAAHEIRNDEERTIFFKQLNSALRINGKIILVEHLRDLPNFMAYNIGFFHFLPLRTWKENVRESTLVMDSIADFTPFVKIITLSKYGTAS